MKQRLDEISLLRPITIGLLVVMHAFTMYSGGWPLAEGIHPVRAYFWVQKVSFSCMLEMFVFISGYIFGYQLFGQKRDFHFGLLVVNKLRRLILPCVLFSLLYILFFTDMFELHQWTNIVYSSFAGYAHIWFLPMLFWCFLGGWALVKCKLNDGLVLAGLITLSILSHFPLPLRLNMACYYLFFFYLGICLFKHRERLISFAQKQPIALLAALIVYLVYVVLQTRTIETLSGIEATGILNRYLLAVQINACKVSYATIGVVILYLIAIYITSRKQLSSFTIELNKYCFAIYIFQQFILEAVYYHTPLPILVGSYWLPWIGTIGTLLVSYGLARLVLLTRTGRYLIG